MVGHVDIARLYSLYDAIISREEWSGSSRKWKPLTEVEVPTRRM